MAVTLSARFCLRASIACAVLGALLFSISFGSTHWANDERLWELVKLHQLSVAANNAKTNGAVPTKENPEWKDLRFHLGLWMVCLTHAVHAHLDLEDELHVDLEGHACVTSVNLQQIGKNKSKEEEDDFFYPSDWLMAVRGCECVALISITVGVVSTAVFIFNRHKTVIIIACADFFAAALMAITGCIIFQEKLWDDILPPEPMLTQLIKLGWSFGFNIAAAILFMGAGASQLMLLHFGIGCPTNNPAAAALV